MTSEKPITEPEIVKALSHPLRYRLLSVLEQRTASPSELAKELAEPLGNVSYHVRTLDRLGLIRLVRRRTVRGAIEHYYRADSRMVISDDAWGDVPDVVKGALVRTRLDETLHYAARAARAGGFNADESHLSRTTLELDEEGWHALSDELRRSFERVREIAQAATTRLAAMDGDAPPPSARRAASVVLMLFEGGEPPAEKDEKDEKAARVKR